MTWIYTPGTNGQGPPPPSDGYYYHCSVHYYYGVCDYRNQSAFAFPAPTANGTTYFIPWVSTAESDIPLHAVYQSTTGDYRMT